MVAEQKPIAGTYRIARFLGEGGIGRVFLAYEGERQVALKFLENAMDPKLRSFFKEEVRLLSLFSHPNLVKIYDYFDKEGDWELLTPEKKLEGQVPPRGPAFSMEYVEGESLEHLPRSTPAKTWIDILAQVCHGLHYLHARNVLHRDLKPSNILRTADGQIKILDFSISTTRQEDAPGSSQVGTISYMPPEAFLGEFDFRSDLFSLGVLLYQLLAGRFPYARPLTPKGMREIKTPPPLSELRPDLPDYLGGIVDRMLQPSPLDRPSSAFTILRILQEHADYPIYRFDRDEAATVFLKTPLLGRDRELEIFAQASRPSPENRGPKFFLVTGPTGSGRSRLVEAFKWRQLLNGTSFFSFSPQDAAEWLPVLIARLGSDKAMEKGRDFFSLLETFQKLSGDKYRVFAFSDLHEWPEGAFQQVKIFLRRLADSRVRAAVILEYNSDWRDLRFGWEGEADFGAEIQRFPLNDLSLDQSVELIAQANLGPSLPRPEAEKIAKASGGRPLLLMEALRHWLVGGEAEIEPEKRTLPKNLEEVSRQRIGRLSPVSRELLALLVAAFEEVSPQALADLESDSQREVALLELDRTGFTARRLPEAPNHSLAHPSLKASFRDALPPDVLLTAHRRWLRYWENQRKQGDTSDATLLLIYEHARAASDSSVQARYGLEALSAIAQRGDYSKAIEWSDDLLKIQDPNLNPCHVHAHRAPYFNRLGRFEEGLDAYKKWYELREDDETKLQRVKFFFFTGLTLWTAGREEEAVQRLEQCLQTGDSQAHSVLRPLHARANNLLAAFWEKKGEWSTARTRLEKALGLSEGDPLLLGETEQHLGRLESAALRFEAAELHFQRALEHSRKLNNPQAEAIAWQYLALLAKEQGRLAEAAKHMERALKLAQRGGEIHQWARYLGNRGAVCLEQGEWEQALEDFRRSEETLRFVGGEVERDVARIQLATAYLLLGNRGRFHNLLVSLEKDVGRLEAVSLDGSFFNLQGEAAYRQGNFPASENFFRKGLAALPPSWSTARLHARWAILRAMVRGGEISVPEIEAFLESLPKKDAPFLAWRAALVFLTRSREALGKKDFTACETAFSNVENPLMRLDLFELIALHLHRFGFKKLSLEMAQRCRQEWTRLHHSLPEEYQMDFEKNHSLQDFEDELQKEPSPPKTRPTPPPKGVSARGGKNEPEDARPGRTQISETRFRQFCEINRQIAQKSDLNDILERVMGAAIELTGAERGYLLLQDPSVKKGPLPGFEVKTARNINQQNLSGGDLQFSFSVVQEAMARGAPLLTDNAQEDTRFRESKSVHQFQLQSILVLPLEIEGTVLGALYLDHRYQPDCFSQEDITMISGFASQAALAIQKARIMEELQAAKGKLEVKVKDQAQHIEVLSEELSQSRKNLKYEYGDIIGRSPAMMKVFQMLDHVTRTKIPVWVWGESGTGKELIARSLHFNSARKEGPFVDENCSAIPENLLESELFGYKKGAFTHAERDRIGLFEQASGGTLFLDEVADMSMGMQVKLLRVLQESEVRPLGANKKVKVDVRLVTASNRDLQKLVQEGKFRQDLFYRINGMTIRLPALRERREDIPLLVHFLVKKIAQEFELKPSEVGKDAFQILMDHPWPGNIRELEGVVRNLLLFAQGKTITRSLFAQHPGLLTTQETAASTPSIFPPEELDEEKLEQKQQLVETLIRHRMDKEKVAEELGISLKSVYSRMERFGIPIKKKELRDFLEREGR